MNPVIIGHSWRGRASRWGALAVLVLVLAGCGESPAPTAVPTAVIVVPNTATAAPPAATVVPDTATTVPVVPTETAAQPTSVPTLAPAPPTQTAMPPSATEVPALSTVTPRPTAPPATQPPADTPVPPADTATAVPADTATAVPPPSTPSPPASGAGEIVFVLDGELAIINPDGSNLRRLGVKGNLTTPRWAPDKQHIAYLQGYGTAAELWVVNRDGSNARRLTTTAGVRESDPRWSPDSSTLGYTRTADTNRDGQLDSRDTSEVWLIDAGGGNARRLADGQDLAWAPDGKRLAFATNGQRTTADPYGRNNTIDMINNLGQNRWSPIKIPNIPQETRLVNPAADFNAGTNFLRYPQWAPNNRGIVFMAQGHSGLIVTATDKGETPTLRDFDYEGGYGRVFWSPDGAKLVYEVLPPSGFSQVTALTLSSKQRVVFGGRGEGSMSVTPAWGPDSARVVYVQGGASAEASTSPAGALILARLNAPDAPQVLVPDKAMEPDWR
ncbi:MAG TPA: hypothetical protein VM536_06345 [Chloroflexia bacterium]|nr:hypothetical protein [Chloroflexia bacterium]